MPRERRKKGDTRVREHSQNFNSNIIKLNPEQLRDEERKEQLNGDENYTQKNDGSIGNTPMVPDWIYINLPEPFKSGASFFTDKREKDTFLLSSIVFLSGCLPNYSFYYDGKKYYTNLYAMLIAPAGSGKGKMSWAKALGKDIICQVKKENESAISDYESDIHLYNSLSKKERSGPPPEEPIPKRPIIPANSSTAFFLKSLHANGGHGIMFETEADVVSQCAKINWYSFCNI